MKVKIALIAVLVVLIAACCVVFFMSSVGAGAAVSSSVNGYLEAFEEQKNISYENTREQVYDIAFEYAEKKHHVSSEYNISIDKVKEIKRLEVLEVSGTDYIVENEYEDSANITCWLEATGKGVYTVDLENAEYLVDKHRCTVTVRLPKPALTSFSVYRTEPLIFKNDIFDDGVALGQEIYDAQIQEASIRIYSALSSNPNHAVNAQESAESLIVSLVKSVNSDYPEIKVAVEFF